MSRSSQVKAGQNRSAYVPVGGGIDLQTPPRQLNPGACLYAVNYECPVSGGYRRIDGYTQVGPEVPGEGPLLGVVTFADGYYAVRKDTGTDTATLHKYNSDTNAWDTVGAVNNGRHEFVEGNMYATETGRALYGVGGGKPFELKKDGTFAELTGAMAGARYITVHSNHLMLGYPEGSLQHSGIGDPSDWDASTGGAGEIGVSDTLTGLIPGRGGVLHVFCRDSVKGLYGSSSADWQLKTTIPNSGAKPYSVQNLMQPYFIAERGISSLQATDQFGDFQPMQPGAKVEPLFLEDNLSDRVKASCISKTLAQYRVFFDNGTGMYLSPTGATVVRFPDQVEVASNGELDNGEEVVLFGDDEGKVYRVGNLATSFNGAPIEAFLTLAYTDLNSTTSRKRFRRVWWDIRSGTEADIFMQPDFDFGRVESARHVRDTLSFILGGGLWSVDDWDEIAWSVPVMGQRPLDIAGSGASINFAIYSSGTSEPHEILGYDLVFDERRFRRG